MQKIKNDARVSLSDRKSRQAVLEKWGGIGHTRTTVIDCLEKMKSIIQRYIESGDISKCRQVWLLTLNP